MAGAGVTRVVKRCEEAKENGKLELHLSSNHLSSLPEELRHVSGLTTLDISNNHFDTLPQVVYRLEALRKLNAEQNGIVEVNVSRLKAITSLAEVNLQENPLTDDVHNQLLEIRVINVLLTPRDPELDAVD
nr:hypothetical protein BaRGS_023171 [Batillaria attramentaria]